MVAAIAEKLGDGDAGPRGEQVPLVVQGAVELACEQNEPVEALVIKEHIGPGPQYEVGHAVISQEDSNLLQLIFGFRLGQVAVGPPIL